MSIAIKDLFPVAAVKGLFMLLLFNFSSLKAQNLDLQVLENLNLNRNQKLDNFHQGLSQSADYVAIATPAALLLGGILKDDKELKAKALNTVIAVLGTYSVGYVLKKTIKRDRPFVTHTNILPVRAKDGYGMPSGSAAVAFATATSLTTAFPKWYIAAPSFGYATAVSYARIRSGEHYPTDILAGAALGTASVWVSSKLTRLINK